jgi:hypothetical protein
MARVHSLPRRSSVVLAFGLPATLALMATRCSSAPGPAPNVAPAPSAAVSAASPASPGASDAAATAARKLVLLTRPVTASDAMITATPADPPPLPEQGQWVFDLRHDKGELFLQGIHHVDLPEPRTTPRVMGRFALELYSGPTLIERVRFDFPMMGGNATTSGDAGKTQPLHGASFSFTAKLNTRVGVMFPATARGTRFVIWDRATGQRWPLPWPPTEMTADPGDAG